MSILTSKEFSLKQWTTCYTIGIYTFFFGSIVSATEQASMYGVSPAFNAFSCIRSFFLVNCTHLLTRTQKKRFKYVFLVKITSA